VGHVVAVVGLEREAAVLRGLEVIPICGGGSPQRLAQALSEAARGAEGIISFGMAGALDPDLRIGDWVVGETVGGAPCDARWIAALAARVPHARIGPVHADGRLIAHSAEKLNLHRTSGCLAVDMESDVAAAAASSAGLPFAVIRCISDEAGTSLPPAIGVAMKPGGGLAIGAVLHSLFVNPGQIPKLGRTIAGFHLAYRKLQAGAETIGRRLAFDLR
jgi:adenosylhomocysteine nucleosidase